MQHLYLQNTLEKRQSKDIVCVAAYRNWSYMESLIKNFP